MITLVALSRIDDNPYQVRIEYSAEKIQDLAEDIARLRPARPETSGLIQVPVGREVVPDGDGGWRGMTSAPPVPPANGRVQLAAGHNRVRAFRYLSLRDPGWGWEKMPVDLVELDDAAMADIAWSENEKRQDLSAIERARAVQRAVAQFGWKQKQIAERWGMSESALSNTMRLLDLPDEVQAMVQRGELPERHARELLPLVQIADKPKLALKIAKEAVVVGDSASSVSWKVGNEVRRLTRDIDVPLMDFGGGSGVSLPAECDATCRVCAWQKHEKCVQKGNYDKRVEAYHQVLEAGASAQVNLPVFSDAYGGVLVPAELERARARNCPNLAVGWRSPWGGEQGRVPVDAEAFPNVCYVCTQRYACKCREVQMTADYQKRMDEDPKLAEYQHWVSEQEQKGKEINSETVNTLYGKYRELVGRLSAKERYLLVAIISDNAHRDCGYDDLDQIAYELTEMVDNAYGMPRTAGLALLRRAKVYQRARLGAAIDEVKARLEILREQARAGELGHPPYGESRKQEISRACEILNAHPGHEDLWSELSELVGEELSALAREISQEKPIANSE